jgi:HAE1 family hydrophobic/amphiphilic exporter-1
MKESHLPPKEATSKAMHEVLGAVIAIGLVLMAVFVPTAFLPGISGSLFKQFALTIAASTGLSVICAVTLSPALCGVILKAHKEGHKPNFFNRGFNWLFDQISSGYGRFVRFLVHPGIIAFTLATFAACIVAIVWTFTKVPTGFVPLEDRGVVLAEVWMPDAASLERTTEAVAKVEEAFASTDGIRNYTSIPGLSMINGAGSNYALLFGGLEDFEERLPRGRGLDVIMKELKEKVAPIPDGLVIVFTLPAVDGVGQASGFDLRVQDRGGVGRPTLGALVQEFVVDGNAQSKLRNVTSAYRAGVPQLFVDVDRERVKQMGIPLQDVFSTMSGYLGSAYVNDLNLFGRTWQLNVSADSRFRARASDVQRLEVRAPGGKMVPLGTLLDVRESMGADRIIRYNLFPAAIVQGVPAQGVSSGESLDVVESMAKAKLPPGVSTEWTALSFQERQIGNQAIVVFAMALLVVYLILAAQYESWTIPFSVILSIPLAVLGAMAGLMWRGMDNNVYTQVGLVLLVGLGAKNAILIVEFAKALREQGKGIVEAAAESARQRLRPILMTALAFILGVTPMMLAKGAGAASQQAIGTAVFFGMIGNTLLGLFFTPVLYVVIQAVQEKVMGAPKPPPAAKVEAKPHAAH